VTELDHSGADVAEPMRFPLARSCPFGPPPEYTRLRAEEPISKVSLRINGKTAWLITRYEDVRQVLSDSRVSANWKLPGFPLQVQLPPELLAPEAPVTLFNMDPPLHTVHRRMLLPEFTVRRVEALRPQIQSIVDENVGAMAAHGGPIDLVGALAVPVPVMVMCEMLGVPYADRAFLQEWAKNATSRETTPEQQVEGHLRISAYMDDLIAGKEKEPADDLISRLIIRNNEERKISLFDINMLCRALIGAAQSTANMISLGTLALLEHPDQLAALKADPSLMSRAVDELARFISIADTGGTARVATEDIEVGGVTIRAGDGILASVNSANHDESVFADPDRLDIQRESGSHIAFGHGFHKCIGMGLARLELEIVYRTLFERLPGLRLAGSIDDVRFKEYDELVYDVYGLRVAW
jgi:cytochrome P450